MKASRLSMRKSLIRRRRARLAATAATSALLFLALVPQAVIAEVGTFYSDRSAWFWASNSKMIIESEPNPDLNVEGVNTTIGGTGVGPSGASASPISLGHIGVSMKDGNDDMRGFVHVDTSLIPFESNVKRYLLVLEVSRAGHHDRHADDGERPPATVNDANAAIKACAAASYITHNSEGDPPYTTKVRRTDKNEVQVTTLRNEPRYFQGFCIEGVRAGDGATWSFDLTDIARRWASGEIFDDGVALVPIDRGVRPTWTVEFHGAETYKEIEDRKIYTVKKSESARAFVDYEPGVGPPPPPPPPVFEPPTFTPPTFPTFEPPAQPPAADPGTTPPVTTGPFVPVAGQPQTPWWWYLVFPLGILGFGAVSNAVGPDGALAAAGGNRVASLLRERRVNGAGGASEAQAIASEEISGEGSS